MSRNEVAAASRQLSDRDRNYLDLYYDEVAMMAKYYAVDPILILAVGIESGFASTGTYLRTGDAFGLTGGSTAHMTTAMSAADDVRKFFVNYGSQIWGAGSNVEFFIDALEGAYRREDAEKAERVPGWKEYNSKYPGTWRTMIRGGITTMQRDVPIYLQQRGR
jgi:hypothetical protein